MHAIDTVKTASFARNRKDFDRIRSRSGLMIG